MPRPPMFRKPTAKVLMALFFLPLPWGQAGASSSSPSKPNASKASKVTPDAAATVVVFNRDDPSSQSLAAAYAAKRGIPFDHLVGLSCPGQETISRAAYDATIAAPLRKTFVERGWWRMEPLPTRPGSLCVAESSIRFVALLRGVPLRIAAEAQPYPGDDPSRFPPPLRHDEASVDSELALLGRAGRQISGPLKNPFANSLTRANETVLFPPELLLVCRLDAASPRTVQRMIDDAAIAEKKGLWGFAYVDSRHLLSGALAEGDGWLRTVADDLLRDGIPTIHENTPELFPAGYPMRQAALYFGWYAENASGPFADPAFRFVPGAIAVHIHSFSAVTLRDPGKNWCAPLLERGAAATLGNVYEPYLHFTPKLDLFEKRLLAGFNFAEAAYAAQPVLSWMTTFVGDPLYRPFGARQEQAASATRAGGKGSAAQFAAFRDGARLWFAKRPAGEAALRAKAVALKSGAIWEGLATLQIAASDPAAAVGSLLEARKLYSNEEDQARCTLHAAGILLNTGKKKAALALLRDQMEATPRTGAAPLLKNLMLRLAAPEEKAAAAPNPALP